jgi:hypothetical protein
MRTLIFNPAYYHFISRTKPSHVIWLGFCLKYTEKYEHHAVLVHIKFVNNVNQYINNYVNYCLVQFMEGCGNILK